MEAHEVGEFVRSQRIKQGMTQLDVAELSEVSERFIRELETGKPTVRLDKTIAVLGVLGFDLTCEIHNANFSNSLRMGAR
ncbi:helix-turn-helix transcriptional regulator [Corynebacterium uterequi]|uniref:Transcriptional regulator, y4mF family n=1 Tax=Corynebacterium uterequi TaxID=1072256 RepID=A0A0G3HBB0_9CORY|nr:helix-turn-helix transcriptional regulator [Corynebacterium uterequi]AKK10666.1 transcriptional regulator, y4mF family [Corynebacterium uterequi]